MRQDPPAGTEIADGDAVTISYYRGEGIGTVTPSVAELVRGALGLRSGAARVRAREPGARALPGRGRVGRRRGHRRAQQRPGVGPAHAAISPTCAAPPPTPTPRSSPWTRTRPAPRRCSPRAKAPSSARRSRPTAAGSRSSSEVDLDAGGALCVVVPPATAPRCRFDDAFRYYRPEWSDDGLYALRRKAGTTGQDELLRVGADLVPTGRPARPGRPARARGRR